MMNLFSSFDMIQFNFVKLIYISMILILISSVQYNYLVSFSNYLSLFQVFLSSMLSNKFKMFNLKTFCLFFTIFLMNVVSIFSYNFPFTSQLNIVMIYSFLFCFCMISFIHFKNIKGSLSHYIPEGTPFVLIPLIFVIEIVSMMIRPLTLMVRLLANIMAGHLLMILLSKLVFMLFPIFLIYLVLTMVELFVSLIQSYIFMVLISLYFSEVK